MVIVPATVPVCTPTFGAVKTAVVWLAGIVNCRVVPPLRKSTMGSGAGFMAEETNCNMSVPLSVAGKLEAKTIVNVLCCAGLIVDGRFWNVSGGSGGRFTTNVNALVALAAGDSASVTSHAECECAPQRRSAAQHSSRTQRQPRGKRAALALHVYGGAPPEAANVA